MSDVSPNIVSDLAEVLAPTFREYVRSLVDPLVARIAVLEHEAETSKLRARIKELEQRGFSEASER